MPQIVNGEEELAAADFPKLRLFNVPRVMKAQEADDTNGKWVVCTLETVRGFSALLYLFGREIQKETCGELPSFFGILNYESTFPPFFSRSSFGTFQ